MPELFAALRGLIDGGRRRGRTSGRFLLLGSASVELALSIPVWLTAAALFVIAYRQSPPKRA